MQESNIHSKTTTPITNKHQLNEKKQGYHIEMYRQGREDKKKTDRELVHLK